MGYDLLLIDVAVANSRESLAEVRMLRTASFVRLEYEVLSYLKDAKSGAPSVWSGCVLWNSRGSLILKAFASLSVSW